MRKRNSGFPVKNLLLIGGGVLLVSALIKDRKSSGSSGSSPVSGGGGAVNAIVSAGMNTAATAQNSSSVLARGSKGAFVKTLQYHINTKIDSLNLDYTKLVLDGDFGSKTEAAMLAMYGVKSATLAQVTSWGTTAQMLAMKKVNKSTVTASDILNNFLNPFGK